MPTVTIDRIDGDAHETVFGIRDDTVSRGIDFDGALITATYADGTVENLVWEALDPFTNGAAEGTDFYMFFDWRQFDLSTTRLLTSFEMNLQPSSSVFDTRLASDGDPAGGSTPSSEVGFPFALVDPQPSLTGNVSVTYSDIVNLAGRPADGDLYTTIFVDFSGLDAGGVLGDLQWNSDIDTMRFAGDLVPVDEGGGGDPVGQVISGSPGPDDLPGGAGSDTIIGLGSNDRLIGAAGDDILNGGSGEDTAVFEGAQSSYSLVLSPTQATVTDRRAADAGGQGTDTLINIEFLDFGTEIALFDGSPMPLSLFDGPTTLTASQFSEIIELYIAYFNRAPDALGLFYWATEYANGFTIQQMADNFFGQPETQATYASLLVNGALNTGDPSAVGDFVTAVYNNVLGRDPDFEGFTYWTGELANNADITPPNFIQAIINGAKFPGAPTEQTAIDQAYLATKSDLGAYFSVIRGMSDIDDATAAMGLFDGSDASRDAAIAAIDGHYADALDPTSGDFLMPLVGVIDDPFAGL